MKPEKERQKYTVNRSVEPVFERAPNDDDDD